MIKQIYQTGDVVSAAFRPDNVGIVERAYSEGGDQLLDVRRPGRDSICGAPAKAFNLVLEGVKLYAIGLREGSDIVMRTVVVGEDGLEMWIKHHPLQAGGASVAALKTVHCHVPDGEVGTFLVLSSPWCALAELLADESALGIVR